MPWSWISRLFKLERKSETSDSIELSSRQRVYKPRHADRDAHLCVPMSQRVDIAKLKREKQRASTCAEIGFSTSPSSSNLLQGTVNAHPNAELVVAHHLKSRPALCRPDHGPCESESSKAPLARAHARSSWAGWSNRGSYKPSAVVASPRPNSTTPEAPWSSQDAVSPKAQSTMPGVPWRQEDQAVHPAYRTPAAAASPTSETSHDWAVQAPRPVVERRASTSSASSTFELLELVTGILGSIDAGTQQEHTPTSANPSAEERDTIANTATYPPKPERARPVSWQPIYTKRQDSTFVPNSTQPAVAAPQRPKPQARSASSTAEFAGHNRRPTSMHGRYFSHGHIPNLRGDRIKEDPRTPQQTDRKSLSTSESSMPSSNSSYTLKSWSTCDTSREGSKMSSTAPSSIRESYEGEGKGRAVELDSLRGKV